MCHELTIASLLLIAGASGATAQNLPIFLSAPVVQNDCPPLDASYTLPGAASCVRFGGSVWAGASFVRALQIAAPVLPAGRVAEAGRVALSSQRPQARLSFDARTDTPYGPIRAYVSIRAR